MSTKPAANSPVSMTPPVSTTPAANSPPRHRWQTMGTISGCRYLKVNLKAKIYIYVNSTIQRCPNKIIKKFLIEDFFICHRCQQNRWSTLSCRYLRDFSKKFETALMVYSGAWGKLIHENTRSRKFRGAVPLRVSLKACKKSLSTMGLTKST